MCDCGADEETVVYLLFHCNKHEQARTVLNDALEEFSSLSDCKRTISDITTVCLNTANHHKSPQISMSDRGNHRKSLNWTQITTNQNYLKLIPIF